jgi:hypothetical protein
MAYFIFIQVLFLFNIKFQLSTIVNLKSQKKTKIAKPKKQSFYTAGKKNPVRPRAANAGNKKMG